MEHTESSNSYKERLEVRLKRLVETTPSDADFKVNRNACNVDLHEVMEVSNI